jgi:hypothetical protein
MSKSDAIEQPQPGLTVDELAAKMGELSAHGYGAARTCVMYRGAMPAIGPSSSMPVTGASPGIDWNDGTVYLHTQKMLGADDESLERVRKRGNELASKLFNAQSILTREGLSDEERVTQLKALLEYRRPAAPVKR